MQWPDWFTHTDRYWLVCTLNEHAHSGEPASIDALVGAVMARLPLHLSARSGQTGVLTVIEQTAHLLFDEENAGLVRRRHHDRSGIQRPQRQVSHPMPAAE